MKIADVIESLPPDQRERFIGRIEGMEMAMRICRNRCSINSEVAEFMQSDSARFDEAQLCAATIRLVQVQLGSGRGLFPGLTPDEQAEIDRIY